VRLVGSGSILQQVIAAQSLLAERLGVAAEVYSAPSWPEARRDALRVDRWNRLHPAETPRVPFVSTVLGADGGPIIAASDWMKALPDLVRPWIEAPFVTLGTDGFGRSDTRESLRSYFEIDAPHIAAAALAALARAGEITADAAAKGIAELGVDPDKADPLEV
jgi:pyruvate dehydrogenase E1 component